jgi:hypothetical protein
MSLVTSAATKKDEPSAFTFVPQFRCREFPSPRGKIAQIPSGEKGEKERAGDSGSFAYRSTIEEN